MQIAEEKIAGGIAAVSLDNVVKRHLLKEMLRIRLVDEKIADLYPEQEMRCPVHLSIGQEAPPVGVCAHLSPRDYAMSGHRSHGHYLAKGGDLKRMMAEIYGKATGCSAGKGGSMHLIDLSVGFLGATPIVSSTIPIAVGAAFTSSMKGDGRITAIFHGDAATEEGVFHEAINFAALKKLPAVFVCENNGFSVYSPMGVRQPAGREVYQLAKGHGVESLQCDGNSIEEIYQLAGYAVEKARAGNGPIFLEFITYRWREHCGPNYDNNIGYREESEFLEWKSRCPVETFENELAESGNMSRSEMREIREELSVEIEDAVRFAKESPFPDNSEMMKQVYAP